MLRLACGFLLALGFSFAAAFAQLAPNTSAAPPLAVSDAIVQFSIDGKNWSKAVATYVYPSWLRIPGATWLWRSALVSPEEAHDGSPVITFRRLFNWNGVAGSPAAIQIVVDNAYDVTVNGTRLGGKGTLDRSSNDDQLWHAPDRYTFPLKKGQNEVLIRAVNYHSPNGSADPKANPGGIVFRVDGAAEDAATLANAIKNSGKVDVYGILFDFDKADLKPDSKSTLDQVSKLLKDDPALRLEIAGHTDSTGTKQHNIVLSKSRADAVVQSLVKDYGISGTRLVAKGYGDTIPVAPNDSDANRAKNRRVELRKI